MSAPARVPGLPTTIDEVIDQLGHFIARSIQTQSRLVAPLSPNQWTPHLALRDLEATALAELVRYPIGLIFKLGLIVIRSRESNDVARVIDVLNQTPTEGV